jgi:hypothetical protein
LRRLADGGGDVVAIGVESVGRPQRQRLVELLLEAIDDDDALRPRGHRAQYGGEANAA